jgi:hypothetical protein
VHHGSINVLSLVFSDDEGLQGHDQR